MLLRIDPCWSGTRCILALSGEVDLDTVELLREAVTTAIRADCHDLVVDLNDVTYIDSAGLGVLVGTHKRLTADQRSLTVRCSEPRVLRLFAITGLTDLFAIDQTAPEPRPSSGDVASQLAV
jgi:anti-sigma B factor antagonist